MGWIGCEYMWDVDTDGETYAKDRARYIHAGKCRVMGKGGSGRVVGGGWRGRQIYWDECKNRKRKTLIYIVLVHSRRATLPFRIASL